MRAETDNPLHPVIIYDGNCNLCDYSVKFIVKRDKNDLFLYSPFKSAFSESLAENFGTGISSDSSLLLICENEVYSGSKAIIKISELLKIAPLLVRLLRNIPVKLLDYAYKIIASNRYRLFGKCESCPISKELPGSEVRYR